MKYLVLAFVALLAVLFLQSRGGSAAAQSTSDHLRTLVRDNGALLVDVRSPGEYASGHMNGALNLPVDRVRSFEAVEADRDREIVLYCRSGARSSRAASTLRSMGYTNVHDLGPMRAW